MNVAAQPTPLHLLNLLILTVAVYHSGGVPVINYYYLTLLLAALVVLRAGLRRTFASVPFLLYTGIIAAMLVGHYFLSDLTQNPKLYVLYLAYAMLALAMALHYLNTTDDFALDLRRTLTFFLIWSVVGFFAQFVAGSRIVSYSFNNYEGNTLWGIFWYPDDYESELPIFPWLRRSQGLFWEPGVLQIYLNTLLYLSLYCRPNGKLALAALIGIFLSFSTAGYVVACFVISPWLIHLVRRRPALFPAAFVISTVLAGAAAVNLWEKVDGSGARSAHAREHDFKVGLELVREYPWVGVGLSQERMLDLTTLSYLQSQGGPLHPIEIPKFQGFTSSLVYLACGLGLFGFAFFLYCFYRQLLFPEAPWLWMGMVMLCSISEPVLSTPFFLMFPVSGLLAIFSARTARATFAERGYATQAAQFSPFSIGRGRRA